MRSGFRLAAGTVVLAFAFTAPVTRPAQAAFTFTMLEVGADVVVTGSGSVNLQGLSISGSGTSSSGIIPTRGILSISGASGRDTYMGVTPVPSFGTGSGTLATSYSGDGFYLTPGRRPAEAQIGVPAGYISGTPLSNTMTFAGSSFTSLGVTPGSYTWTWSSDSVTLQIGPTGIPEPTSALLLGAGLLGLRWSRRRRGGQPA